MQNAGCRNLKNKVLLFLYLLSTLAEAVPSNLVTVLEEFDATRQKGANSNGPCK